MVARNLLAKVPSAQVEIIDKRNYHEYTPGVLRALVDPDHLPLLHTDMHHVIAGPSWAAQFLAWWPTASTSAAWFGEGAAPAAAADNITFTWADVTRVDFESRQVHATRRRAGGAQLSRTYDFLVLATGSDYAAPMKPTHAEGDLAVRQACIRAVAKRVSCPSVQRAVVVGGGAVGVEMAGELATHHPNMHITLISSAPSLLHDQPSPVGSAALAWFQRRGVKVLLGTRAKRTDAAESSAPAASTSTRSRSRSRSNPGQSVPQVLRGAEPRSAEQEVLFGIRGGTLELQDGGTLHGDVIFTCVGFKPCSDFLRVCSSGTHPFVLPGGQVQVDRCLAVPFPTGHASSGRVFAAGDVALHAGTSELKLAHTAELQAHLVAANIARSVQQEFPSAKPSHGSGTVGAVLWLSLVKAMTLLWSVCILPIWTVLGCSKAGPVQGLGVYPDAISGFPSWPNPRVMCLSLGPHEALLVFNGLLLTSSVGRRIGALAKWFIESSKVWQVRDLALGHAIWALGDAAAITLGNFVVLPLARNQPRTAQHRVSTQGSLDFSAGLARLLWQAWAQVAGLLIGCLGLLPGVSVQRVQSSLGVEDTVVAL